MAEPYKYSTQRGNLTCPAHRIEYYRTNGYQCQQSCVPKIRPIPQQRELRFFLMRTVVEARTGWTTISRSFKPIAPLALRLEPVPYCSAFSIMDSVAADAVNVELMTLGQTAVICCFSLEATHKNL